MQTYAEQAKENSLGLIRIRLVSALTQFDARQKGKKGYNPHALGIYFRGLQEVYDPAVESGKSPRHALFEAYNGRLLDALLVAIGEPKFTRDEQREFGL